MNNKESRRLSKVRSEERVARFLRDVASPLMLRGDPDKLVEQVLARGTDRLFSCDSPLGEVYVGVSDRGVCLVGKATSSEGFARRYRERFGRLLSWGTDERTQRLAARSDPTPGWPARSVRRRTPAPWVRSWRTTRCHSSSPATGWSGTMAQPESMPSASRRKSGCSKGRACQSRSWPALRTSPRQPRGSSATPPVATPEG